MRTLLLLALFVCARTFAAVDSSEHFSTEMNLEFEKIRPTKASFWSFQAALQAADYSYKEPSLMKMEGTKSGFSMQAQKFDAGQVQDRRWILFGEFLGGSTDYTGATVNLATGERKAVTAEDSSYFYNLTASRGFRLLPMGEFVPWLGAGVGYRFLVTKPKNSVPGDYRREQSYLYLPLHAELARQLSPKTTLHLGAEYDIFLRGQNTSYLFGDLKFRQSSGSGIGLSSAVTKAFTPSLTAFLALKFHRWSIAASDTATAVLNGRSYKFHEPKNSTEQTSLSIGLYF